LLIEVVTVIMQYSNPSETVMKLLFAADLKEPRNITDQVQELATHLNAELFVLHVHVPTPAAPLAVDPMSGFGEMAYALYDPSVERSIVEAEKHDFDRFVSERFSMPVRPALLQGDAARVILDDADELGVDMIIMAKRRRSAIQRMILGSVTHVVSRESSHPILLLPIADE
jgi:nucleotide-binding universal stress UspA family protein